MNALRPLTPLVSVRKRDCCDRRELKPPRRYSFVASISSRSRSGKLPSSVVACFASSRGTCPVRWAKRAPLSGKTSKMPYSPLPKRQREPRDRARLGFDERLCVAQELLDRRLVPRFCAEGEQDPFRDFPCRAGRQLRGKNCHLLNRRRLVEQRVGLAEQRARDRAVQVNVTLGVRRKRVEDPEIGTVEAQCEPRRRARLLLYQRQRRRQKLGCRVPLIPLSFQAYKQSNVDHDSPLHCDLHGASPARMRIDRARQRTRRRGASVSAKAEDRAELQSRR